MKIKFGKLNEINELVSDRCANVYDANRVRCRLRFFTVRCDFDICLLALHRILIVTKSKKSAAVIPALGSLHQTPVF